MNNEVIAAETVNLTEDEVIITPESFSILPEKYMWDWKIEDALEFEIPFYTHSDIIYAEVGCDGSMGYGRRIVLFIVEPEKLIRYKIQGRNLYGQISKRLIAMSGYEEKAQFYYGYGGFGNHVLLNKEVKLEVMDGYFIYKKDGKEYRIDCSGQCRFNEISRIVQREDTTEI